MPVLRRDARKRKGCHMRLSFTKLHGLGNDFVVVDDRARSIELTPAQVQRICDRHFGVGADGIILVRPSERSSCAGYMHYINSDGTLAQMCGNGVRCFAKFLVDNGVVDPAAGSLVADTLAGSRPITFTVNERGELDTATVDMGAPILDPVLVPVDASANAVSAQDVPYVRELPLESPWGTFRFTCVSMGNPHAVCFLDDLEALDDALFPTGTRTLAALDLDRIGSFYECHDAFPEKTNVEFAVVGTDGIEMRVYERGCGETLACGTGACATNVAAALTGRASCENDVRLRGGTLHIVWAADNHVFMTGAARESFRGEIELGDEPAAHDAA